MLPVNSVSNISFTSRYVDKVKVLKGQEPYFANLVHFDLPEDMTKIKELCYTKDFISFGRQLYSDLNRAPEYPVIKKYCFALVNNNEKDFSNINIENVMGIYTLHESYVKEVPIKITYFITKYDYQYGTKPNREYSEIGRGMYNSIKKQFPNKSLSGLSAVGAVSFWEKMGLEKITDRILIHRP